MAGIGLKKKQRVEFADLERFFSLAFRPSFRIKHFYLLLCVKNYLSFLSISMHIPGPRLLVSYVLIPFLKYLHTAFLSIL